MSEVEARRVLGVSRDAGHDAVRAAYRRLLLQHHPDLNGAIDATERTVQLTEAYRTLVVADGDDGSVESGPDVPDPGDPAATASPAPAPHHVAVALLDAETLGVAAPPDETLMLLIDAAHRLGDISYLDRTTGLIEVIVEFVEAPTSSVVMSLQGRSSGVTEVFCTVEPLSGGEAPPAPAVVRLLLDTLVGAGG